MCGRYVMFSTPEQLVAAVRHRTGEPTVSVVGDGPRPNFNIAPTHMVSIVRYFRDAPAIGPATWGYPPKTVFNARGETVFDKRTFQGSARCVFVMDGWYEWTSDPQAVPGDRKKQPWFTYDNQDGADGLIFIAGLCKVIDGQVHATMVTTAAIDDMQWLHHRMPRVLVGDEVKDWLLSASPEDDDLLRRMAARPAAAGLGSLTSHKVSKDVGNVANNNEELIVSTG